MDKQPLRDRIRHHIELISSCLRNSQNWDDPYYCCNYPGDKTLMTRLLDSIEAEVDQHVRELRQAWVTSLCDMILATDPSTKGTNDG